MHFSDFLNDAGQEALRQQSVRPIGPDAGARLGWATERVGISKAAEICL